jgi:hypothetical protein
MTPIRARTLPHDYLANIAKRNSLPDSSSHDVPAQPIPNPHLINLNSTLATSPLGQYNNFSTPQLGQSQIPDLTQVMFPSDNPFAYPNQPISTLESVDARYGYPDPSTGGMDSPFSNTPPDGAMLGTPSSIQAQMITSNPDHTHAGFTGQHLDMAGLQRIYEENPQLANHLAQQQQQQLPHQRQFSQGPTSMSAGPMPFGHDQQQAMYGMPQQMPQQNSGGSGTTTEPEDYWTHMNKSGGVLPSRSGFTPGATVNLDELFGGGDGWGASGMWESPGFPRQ